MKKSILTIIAVLSLIAAKAQQTAQFSQYLFNGLYINPAYAGYKETVNLHAFYRNQWTGVEGAPKTLNVAVDASANDGNVGLALHAFNDKLGAQINNGVYGSYAYRVRFDEAGDTRLSFGLSAGMAQYGLDNTLLNTNDPDVLLGTGVNRVLVPDARAGVYFSTPRFFAGVSADNLVASLYNEEKFRNVIKPVVHSYVTAGGLIPLSTDILLKPSFLIKEDFHGPTSLDLNTFILFGESLWIGGGYRTSIALWKKNYLQSDLKRPSSAVAAIEVFPTKNIRIGYAYDMSLGALTSYGAGSHEISLFYTFGRKNVRMGTPRLF